MSDEASIIGKRSLISAVEKLKHIEFGTLYCPKDKGSAGEFSGQRFTTDIPCRSNLLI